MILHADNWFPAYTKIFGLALAITTALTPIVRILAIKAGVLDIPSHIKLHHRPTPRLGGIAIYFGFLLSLLFTGALTSKQEAVLIGSSVALMIGILDDTRSVSATVKLLSLFLITFYLARRGVILNLIPQMPVANFILTLFWIVGVTSAFNAIDNMDGLAGGLTFFASLAYAYVAVQNTHWMWGALSVALMGSCLGFLFYNFPPASIFMGDSGSFFLGYTLAVLSVMGEWSTHPVKAVIVPVFILGLPIFDLMYVVVKRQRKGITKSLRQIVTFCAKDHFSHRLLELGMTTRQALLFSYASALALSIGAVAMRYVLAVEAILLCVQFTIIAFLFVILMEYGNQKPDRRKDAHD